MGLDDLSAGISGLVDDLSGLAQKPVAALIGGAVIGSAVTGAVIGLTSSRKASRSRHRKKSGRKIKHTKRGWKQDRKRKSKQKWEVAYRKRKRKHKSKSSRSKRGLHYTKNGQPYKILANGRARFVKGRRKKRR